MQNERRESSTAWLGAIEERVDISVLVNDDHVRSCAPPGRPPQITR
jgi:hypothetical protein